MKTIVSDSPEALGKTAAKQGGELIRQAIREKGHANIILATGASQFEMLKALLAEEIDWQKITAFHLDEYIGLPESHPASFRKYLKERFANLVPVKEFVYVNGEGDPAAECRRLGEIIARHPIDVAFVGIGENGHLAFNDPPADFETWEAYIVVDLDDDCRRQQMGEGWFATLDEVPHKAISMSIRQILKSRSILCSVPDLRKATAVQKTIESPVSPLVPASVLRRHSSVWLYLDKHSSSLLSSPST